jgi:hypothetical protein
MVGRLDPITFLKKKKRKPKIAALPLGPAVVLTRVQPLQRLCIARSFVCFFALI